MTKLNQKAFFSLPVVIVLAVVILIGLVVFNYSHVLKSKDDQIATLQNAISSEETEIKGLINDQATLVKKYTVPYQFETFGIYSPFFNGKQVSVSEYLYKRSVIKKMTITLDKAISPSKSFSNHYVVNIWEYTGYLDKDDNLKVVVDYDSQDFLPEQGYPVVKPLTEIKSQWGASSVNGHNLALYNQFNQNQPGFSAVDFESSISPNGHYHFGKIGLENPGFSGVEGEYYQYYQTIKGQIDQDLKEIGASLSPTTY